MAQASNRGYAPRCLPFSLHQHSQNLGKFFYEQTSVFYKAFWVISNKKAVLTQGDLAFFYYNATLSGLALTTI